MPRFAHNIGAQRRFGSLKSARFGNSEIGALARLIELYLGLPRRRTAQHFAGVAPYDERRGSVGGGII